MLTASMSWRPLTTNAAGAGHRVDHPLDARANSPPGRAAAPACGPVVRGASQVEKDAPLGLVQTERARDRFQHALGNARQAAALHRLYSRH